MALVSEIAPDLFLVDGPGGYLWRLPVPTRVIVRRWPDGGLWIYGPARLSDALRDALRDLGQPQQLIIPNRRGLRDLAAWIAAFPDLTLYGARGVLELAKRAELPGDWQCLEGPGEEDQDPKAQGPWAPDLCHVFVKNSWGGPESVFFHRASRSLILGDMIVNLPTSEMPLWTRPLIWLAGIDDSDGKMPPTLRRYDKDKLGDEVAQLLAWDIKHLLLLHGRCYHTQGQAELKRAFRRILRDRDWDQLLQAAKAAEKSER